MFIEYCIQVNMYNVSAQGVDEHMIIISIITQNRKEPYDVLKKNMTKKRWVD